MELVTENHLTIRQARPPEIQVLGRWIKDEGWDHSTYDLMSQLKIDPTSLLVMADQDDKPRGFGSAIDCMNGLVYLANYIVRADLRGKGFGRILFRDEMMQRLGNINGVLDSVPEMADTYRKYGFIYPGVNTVRFTITIDNDIKFKPFSDNTNIQVKPLENDHWPGILQYDKTVYPTIDREKILRAFFVGPGVTTLVALEQDKVVGFGSLHKKDEGLFGLRSVQAEDEEIAERIIQLLFQHAGNGSACQFVYPKENHLNIRPGKQNEIQVLERWIKDEGWDHSTYDTMSQLKIDPNSLLVAADQDDKPVGFGSAIACMNDLVYVDNFIVRADFRGKGFGRILLKDGIMKRLVNRNGVLDSLPAMADTYKKYGFIYPGVRTVLLTITIDRDIMFKPLSDNINIQVKPLENSHWPGILQFDKTVYPTIDREKILRAFFVGPNVTTLVALEQDKVVGFGSLHKKDEGLFGLRSVQAEDEEIAERIIQMLFQHAGNGSACQLVFPKGKGLPTCMKSARQGVDLIRLYTKCAIVVNTDKIWATTVHIV